MLGHIEGRGARGERRARQGLRQREGHGGVFQTMNRISFTVAMPTIQKLLVIKWFKEQKGNLHLICEFMYTNLVNNSVPLYFSSTWIK